MKTNGIITPNAVQCGICGSGADRRVNRFECRANPGHIGDLYCGIFTDRTYPDPTTEESSEDQAK